jgi:hypothetical protein
MMYIVHNSSIQFVVHTERAEAELAFRPGPDSNHRGYQMARATKPYTTSQEEADALLTAHQQNRIARAVLRARTEALQDYEDTIAFERYLAELAWERS